MLEVFCVILPQVLDVVVAGNKVYFPVQPVQYVYPFGRTAQTKITQVEHDILRTNYSIPISNNRFIHVRHILEWPVAEPDDIGMVEVGVGCKEHPASVKFIIHNLFIHAHHCAVNNTLQFCPWTELTRRAHRANVTSRHIIKTVEKFGKDFPTVFIYHFNGIPASSYPQSFIKR